MKTKSMSTTIDSSIRPFITPNTENSSTTSIPSTTEQPISESLPIDPDTDEEYELLQAKADKQKRREAGKLRAIQIAKDRLLSPAADSGSSEETAASRHNGHGSHNSSRSRVFVKFVLATFFPLLNEEQKSKNPSTQKTSDELNVNDLPHPSTLSIGHVLDVAGGAGEVSVRLSYCHKIPSTMIDIRHADLLSCLQKRVVPFLPKKWQERHIEKDKIYDPSIDTTTVWPNQLTLPFSTIEQVEGDKVLMEAMLDATLLLGLHADASTEVIVDLALKYNKSFAVVPCCVFPNLFNSRTIVDGNGNVVKVKSYEQFVQYLFEKGGAGTEKARLGFEGRDFVVFRNVDKC